jgi:hypothetical protein
LSLIILRFSFALPNFKASSRSTTLLNILLNSAKVPSASVVELSAFNKYKEVLKSPDGMAAGLLPDAALKTKLLLLPDLLDSLKVIDAVPLAVVCTKNARLNVICLSTSGCTPTDGF